MSPRRHRLDGTHHAVRARLEAEGWLFEDVSQTDLGYDAILTKGGRTVRAEIKNGALSPSRRRLTQNEVEKHARLKAHGVLVEILTGDDESLNVLREPFRNMYDKTL